MSLLVLMYHRARAGRHGNAPEILAAHFAFLASSATPSIVLPGDPLTPGRLNVCLTFDDGFFDFYATIFPLLKKHDLRAMLAIPPSVVCEKVKTAHEDRARLDSDEAFTEPGKGGFCTWAELQEMADSGRVAFAAHGGDHVRLDAPNADLAKEIDLPRLILESRLSQPVESFVFPFGRYSHRSLRHARHRYRFVFRIGGALNRSWNQRVLYRVDADCMETPQSLFAPSRLALYQARYFWNRLRGR